MSKHKVSEVYAIWWIAVITIFLLLGILAVVAAKTHLLLFFVVLAMGAFAAIIVCDKCERLIKSLKT